MATQNQKQKTVHASFPSFDGIDVYASHTGKPSTANMENWQIRRDGSIKKRYGFRPLYALDDTVEAIWSGLIDGRFYIYLFSGGQVQYIDLSSESLMTVGTPPCTDKSSPRFFHLGGTLYLAVGGGIFAVTKTSIKKCEGYVPLIGKDWTNDLIGEIHQPLNILNRRGRFTYTVSSQASIFFRVIYPVSTIDSVLVNGIRLSSDRYYFDELFNSVNISGLATGDRVEIAVTFALSNASVMSELLSTNSATVFGGISNSRVFMWDDNGKPIVYSTAFVSNSELKASRDIYPTSDSLYFPEGYEFMVGDGKNKIMSAQRHYDRLLFFTDGDVWMADSSACGYEDLPTMNINSSIGCSSRGAVAMAGNDPVSVGDGKIYRWTSDTDELNECNAHSISDCLGDLLDNSFFKNAKVFSNRREGEVWFYDTEEAHTVWIYQHETGKWFKYTGIEADGFFDANGRVGFFKGNELYIVDPDCNTDEHEDYNQSITTVFESGLIDFGSRDTKRLAGIEFSGENCRSLRIDISPKKLKSQSITATLGGYDHEIFEKRISSGRFTYLTLKLTSSDIRRAVIHDLTIKAKQ